MKLRKYSLVVVGFCVLLGSCFTASAGSLTDGTGDVFYWTGTGDAWAWRQNNVRDNIDITGISSTVDGDKITITLTVVGTIQESEKFGYYFYYNTSDTNYLVMVMGGNPLGMATKQGGGEGSYGQGEVTISGNTITAVFDVLGDTTSQEIWGYAAEWTEVGQDAQNHEWWGDWAPDTKFTGDIDDEGGNGGTGGTDDTGGTTPKPSTPGFEAFAVLAAIGLAFILLKRRK